VARKGLRPDSASLPALPRPAGSVGIMNESDVMLMQSGVSHPCPDCADERLFVPADLDDPGAFCCTVCGAAVLVDVVDVIEAKGDRLRRSA